MAKVIVGVEAQKQLADLPLPIQGRVHDVLVRLAGWPAVSGAKPLRGELKGSWRIRTGDYRVIFAVSPDRQTVRVWRIGYRGDIYDQ